MRRALLAGAAACALAAGQPRAEVATDGTMGARTRLTGRDVTIGADLGTIRGTNLFHSFERFDIETGGSATFTGPAGLDRVISRVTGGTASSIDGTLRSTVPGADFFFINPAGILFGPSARLDVPAAFHASTADELRFPNGAVFAATRPERSVLSVAAPEAFGFLGARPASIRLDQGRLEVVAGESLSLVGGAIAVVGEGTPESAGVLRAPGGALTLASVGAAGTVAINDDVALFAPGDARLFRHGAIDLAAGALASTTSDGGGRIAVRTGRLSLIDGARVAADNDGATGSVGGVTVVAARLDLENGSTITADTRDAGAAGTVAIRAGRSTIRGRGEESITGITSRAREGSTGAAGAVSVTVDDRLDLREGVIASSTAGSGEAGTVLVRAGTMSIARPSPTDLFITGVNGDARVGSSGAAGAVVVEVDGLLEIRSGAAIGSGTFASGAGGSIAVRAGALKLDGRGAPSVFTGIITSAEPESTGTAGELTVRVARRLQILGGGQIASSTGGVGDAGTVTVSAGTLSIDSRAPTDLPSGILSDADEGSSGDAGAVTVDVDGRLDLKAAALITSSTFATGDAGSVLVRAGSLSIDPTGVGILTGITSDTQEVATGDAGTVTVRVDRGLLVVRGGVIGSGTFGSGDAGRVDVEAGRLAVLDRGLIDSSSFAAGTAGSLTVRAGDMTVGAGSRVGSNAEPTSTGAAGELSVTVEGKLEILDGEIGSANFGIGAAGDVTIGAGTLRAEDGAILSSSARALGGRVTVDAVKRASFVDSEVSTNGTLPEGAASVIEIAAPTVLLSASRVTALTGDGQPLGGSGVVSIVSRRALISRDSAVLGSSAVTITGTVDNIRSPSRLAAEPPADPARSLRDCAEERLGGRGTFRSAPGGGLPTGPEDYLGSATGAGRDRSLVAAKAC